MLVTLLGMVREVREVSVGWAYKNNETLRGGGLRYAVAVRRLVVQIVVYIGKDLIVGVVVDSDTDRALLSE